MKTLLTLLILAGCILNTSAQKPDYSIFPSIKGYSLKHEYNVYTNANLWEYINGAADAYLALNFNDLLIGEYKKGKVLIRAEIYRHAAPEMAYGIYALERAPSYNFIPVGAQGYAGSDFLNFLNSSCYVKLYAEGSGTKVDEALRTIAAAISNNINPDPSLPAALSSFPTENQLANEGLFVASGFLGHSFLNRAFTAPYEVNGERFTMFLMETGSPEECRKTLEDLAAKSNEKPQNLQEGYFSLTDPYNGKIFLRWNHNRIFGTYNTENENLAFEYLRKTE
jgi:hypothetical protein